MNIDIIVLTIATLIGLYMAANIGANDLANAMGTSVGSRALTLKQAVLVSIIANVFGAALAGGHVTSTISKGIIDPGLLADEPNRLMLGMFAALISASLWVHLATYFGLPVSTTHAIVGAVVGFGIISVGGGAVSWGKIITIALSWVISPAAGAVIGGSIFGLLMTVVVTLGSVLTLGLFHVNLLYLALIIVPSLLVFSSLGALLCVLVKEVFEAQTLLNLPRFIMMFLCGVVYPVSAMPLVLQCIACLMPLTYTVDGLRQTFSPSPSFTVFIDVLVLLGFLIIFILPATKLLQRRFV